MAKIWYYRFVYLSKSEAIHQIKLNLIFSSNVKVTWQTRLSSPQIQATLIAVTSYAICVRCVHYHTKCVCWFLFYFHWMAYLWLTTPTHTHKWSEKFFRIYFAVVKVFCADTCFAAVDPLMYNSFSFFFILSLCQRVLNFYVLVLLCTIHLSPRWERSK